MILQKTGSSQSYYERIKPARVVGDLFPVTLNVHDPVLLGSKFSFVMDFLQQNECYRVFFGTDMNEFARQIKKLARELDGKANEHDLWVNVYLISSDYSEEVAGKRHKQQQDSLQKIS